MKNPDQRIDVNLSAASQELVKKNRSIIKSLVKCLELCSREGIALRGHRDDGVPSELESQGKFKAVVNFRCESGDDVLKEHIQKTSSRETYVSKTSQNELLCCMGDSLREKIVNDIRESKFYSIIADEVSDTSNWEQLGIVIRYVKNNVPVERLLGYVACESVSGEDIFKQIKRLIQDLGLDLKLCRGQGYDGAGSMAGAQKGCQARLKAEVPQAVYFHCSSHQLNLALSKACSVPEIHRMICSLKSVGIFFKYSPKRQRHLESCIDRTNAKRMSDGVSRKITHKKVKLLCETRWVERHSCMEDFHELYESILICLEEISEPNRDTKRWDTQSMTDATGLLKQIRSSEFLVSFYVCKYFFGFTKNISKSLQGETKDLMSAYEDIQSATSCITAVRRDNCESSFRSIFEDATKARAMSDNEVTIPRRCQRQTLRSNHPSESAEDFWRCSVFVPFADQLIQELNSRFSQMSMTAIKSLRLLPSYIVRSSISNEFVNELKECFQTDLPDPGTFDQEILRWVSKWKNSDASPQSLSDTFSATNPLLYPNIYCILHILLVAPVTSASVERANSSLSYIKNEFRSTMTQDRLNNLILLYVHKDIKLDYDEVVDKFAIRHPRRMILSNPLAE